LVVSVIIYQANAPVSLFFPKASQQCIIILSGCQEQNLSQKRMNTSDLPTSVVVVLYLSIQYYTSRSLQEIHNTNTHTV
jgi:hypothetical protein